MKSFSEFISEKRSKIRQDSKTGDEEGINTKNDTVGTVNITDDLEPDSWNNPASERIRTVKSLLKLGTVHGAVHMPHHKIKEEVERIEEGRGRPKKNPTAEDPGSDNIIMQLRKVITLRGQEPVKFVNGQRIKISPAFAHSLLAKYDALKTSGEKHAFSMRIHKSPESMRDVAAGRKEHKKPAVSLAGRITGTQHESTISTMGSTRATPVTMSSSPRVGGSNAPKSASTLQRAADQRRQKLDSFAQKQTELLTKQRENEVKKREVIAKSNDKIQKAKSKQKSV